MATIFGHWIVTDDPVELPLPRWGFSRAQARNKFPARWAGLFWMRSPPNRHGF